MLGDPEAVRTISGTTNRDERRNNPERPLCAPTQHPDFPIADDIAHNDLSFGVELADALDNLDARQRQSLKANAA